ncbi:MAG TPA: hypothetical protein VJJ52_04260 [Candidatus Nanoarchaeia archaeon]|nr:hypothetical protein [Candidatus Nanoarchaeia archaeon]
MSIDDGIIGGKRTRLFQMRLTREEGDRLAYMAEKYSQGDKSDFIRSKIFPKTFDYVKAEISGAIEKARTGFSYYKSKFKKTFQDYSKLYANVYTPTYGNLAYR